MMRWVLLGSLLGATAAACGDDGINGQLADAPPPIDARVDVDAAPAADAGPDAAVAPVTVTVTLGGVPAPDQTVYFQSRDSATTITVLTGADGVATGMVEPGGYVTVIEPEPPPQEALIGPRTHLSTFADVQPGDQLHVDVPVPSPTGEVVQFTIRVPDEQLGYEYVLHSTCGTAFLGRSSTPELGRSSLPGLGRRRAAIGAEPLTAQIQLTGCGGAADLLVIGFDGENTPRSWKYQADVALTADAMIELTGDYETAVEPSFTYTVTASQRVDVERELRTPRGVLFGRTGSAFPDGTIASTTLAVPVPVGPLAITTSTDNPDSGFSQQGVIDWGAGESYELTIGTDRLHRFTDSPSVDIPGRALLWIEAPEGGAPDFAVGSFTAFRPGGETSHEWTWRIVGAYVPAYLVGPSRLTYPVLPTTLFDFTPRETDDRFVESLTTVKGPGGYAAARPRVFTGDRRIAAGNLTSSIAGATGRIVFENRYFVSEGARKNPTTLRRGGFTRRAR